MHEGIRAFDGTRSQQWDLRRDQPQAATKRSCSLSWLIAAGIFLQLLSVVAVTQEQKPDMDVGRVPELQTPSRAWGTPAKHSQPSESWGGLGTPGTETTQPGGADGTGKPALGGERRPLYRLHKSDVVDVVFTFSPEFNQTVSVQPDGYIRLRAIGSIYAEGRTLPELEDLLRQAYASSLHDPEVTVELKDFDKPYFIAAGEVTRPGKYELRTDTTITEAVAIAGGFSQQARHSQVLLFRRVSDDLVEAKIVDVKKMLNRHTLSEDPHLRPGDMLFVPQSTVSKVRKYLPLPTLGMYMNSAQF